MSDPTQATAQIFIAGKSEHSGTAWLISRLHVLTAAHCIGDRRRRELTGPTFILKFPWGQVSCTCSKIDWNLDAALLAITPKDASTIPQNIVGISLKVLYLEDPLPLGADALSFRATGFPIAHTSTLDLTGKIKTRRGSVDGAEAIQLSCDEGGSGGLGGASGAAARLACDHAFGLVRHGPERLQQRVIFVTAIEKIAEVFDEVKACLEVPKSVSNPYAPWSPSTAKGFVGRPDLLRRLRIAVDEARSISLIGDWRIGKSSLLSVWEEEAGATGRKVRVVNGQNAEGESIGAFVKVITGRDSANDADGAANVLSEWASAHPTGLPPLILVDEADAIIRRFERRFFERLRGMIQNKRLVLVLCTGKEIHSIYQEQEQTSPFENLLEIRWLGLLEVEASELLIQRGHGLLKSGDDAIMREWAGRHPFYLQLLGHCLVYANNSGISSADALVDFRTQASTPLSRQWTALNKKGQQALTEHVRTGDPIPSSSTRLSLIRRGLVTDDGNAFGRILLEWLTETLDS